MPQQQKHEFHTISSEDWRRSIADARSRSNVAAEQIRTKIQITRLMSSVTPNFQNARGLAVLEMVAQVFNEIQHQNQKWGLPNNSPHKWVTILTEEVGEFATEVNELDHAEDTRESFRRLRRAEAELIQAAAVAIQAAAHLHLKWVEIEQTLPQAETGRAPTEQLGGHAYGPVRHYNSAEPRE